MKNTLNPKLTASEYELLYEFAHGSSDYEAIAMKLKIKKSTVKRHLNNIFDKLGVERLHQAVFTVFPPGDPIAELIDLNSKQRNKRKNCTNQYRKLQEVAS